MPEKQVIAGRCEIATILGIPRLPWVFDKPCRTAAGITGSQKAVCRTGGNGVDRAMNYSRVEREHTRNDSSSREV
jgi:hypothetical protein